MDEVKRCPHCDTEKPINEFPRSRNKSSGHGGWCKACLRPYTRGYRLAKLEHYQAVNRAWNHRNLEKTREIAARNNAITKQARKAAGLTVKQWHALSKPERRRLLADARQAELWTA